VRTLRLYAPGQPIEREEKAAAEVHGVGPAWSPDGSALVCGTVGQVRRFDVTTRTDQYLASMEVARAITLSPDGGALDTSLPACHSRRMWIRNFAERPRPE
jgi:hypothetical protein